MLMKAGTVTAQTRLNFLTLRESNRVGFDQPLSGYNVSEASLPERRPRYYCLFLRGLNISGSFIGLFIYD
jgi:hypothetical protein